MTPQKRASLSIKGLKIRTKSETEATNQGKICSLWKSFHDSISPQLQEDDQFYGVFFNNDPEQLDTFDVLAGVTSKDFDKNGIGVSEEISEVVLEEGNYLMFSAVGSLPQATLRAWQQVRRYFNEKDCPYERTYITDYEHYIAKGLTKLYISVKPK